MRERPELTIAIATRERPDLLMDVLRSIAVQRLEDSFFEILVVPDGYSDGTLETCERFERELRELRNGLSFRVVQPWQESHGLAAARNACAAEARGRFIRFQDDDDVIDPYAVDAMLNAHFQYGEGVAVLGYTGFAAHILHQPIMRYLAYEGGEMFNYKAVSDGPLNFDWFWGGRTSVATAVAQAVGFDEQLKFSEDIEFAYRANLETGLSVRFSSSVRGYMIRAVDLDSFVRRSYRQGQEARYAATKHPRSRLEDWAIASHTYTSWSGDAAEVFLRTSERCRRLEIALDFYQRVDVDYRSLRQSLHDAYRETFGLTRALGYAQVAIPLR